MLNNNGFTYAGMQVYVHPDFAVVKRSWKERLFSWPWRPWVSTKQIPNPLFGEDGESSFIFNNMLFTTERTFAKLKAKTRERHDEYNNPHK